jgi:hypothetical protein
MVGASVISCWVGFSVGDVSGAKHPANIPPRMAASKIVDNQRENLSDFMSISFFEKSCKLDDEGIIPVPE